MFQVYSNVYSKKSKIAKTTEGNLQKNITQILDMCKIWQFWMAYTCFWATGEMGLTLQPIPKLFIHVHFAV